MSVLVLSEQSQFVHVNSKSFEVITLGPKPLRNLFLTDGALLNGINLPPSTAVRHLGVLFIWVCLSIPILIMSIKVCVLSPVQHC